MIIKPIRVIREIKSRFCNCITILCIPSIDIEEIKVYIENNTEDEIEKRFNSLDENIVKEEYFNHLDFFDFIAHNDFGKNFIVKVKQYLEIELT